MQSSSLANLFASSSYLPLLIWDTHHTLWAIGYYNIQHFGPSNLHEVVCPLHLGHEVLHCLLSNHRISIRSGRNLVHSNGLFWSQLNRGLMLEWIHHLFRHIRIKLTALESRFQGTEDWWFSNRAYLGLHTPLLDLVFVCTAVCSFWNELSVYKLQQKTVH